MPSETPTRQLWVDYAKGLGILCVVSTHTINGLKAPGVLAVVGAWDFWNDWFYTFQVPVFFFVAGLFARLSYDKYGFSRFMLSKAATIVYPYVLWQTLEILMMQASQGATTHTPEPLRVLMFAWLPYMQFWFLYALFLVFLWYALLRRMKASAATVFAVSIGMLFLPQASWFPWNDLCDYTIYFSLGAMLAGRMTDLRRVSAPGLLLGAAFCAVALTGAVQWGMGYETPLRPCGAVIGIAGVCCVSFLMERTAYGKTISVLGAFSLEIYVAHVVFAAATRIALIKVLDVYDLPVHVVAGITMGLLGPLLTVWLTCRFHVPLFRLNPRSKGSAPAEGALSKTGC